MTILKEAVKELTVPVVFTRQTFDTHGKPDYVFLETSFSLKVWNEEPFAKWKLSLVNGHTGRQVKDENENVFWERQLRVFVDRGTQNVEEITDFKAFNFEGLKCVISEDEKVLTKKEALERVKSGQVMYLTEEFQRRTIYVD
jgi:hypothetical protein